MAAENSSNPLRPTSLANLNQRSFSDVSETCNQVLKVCPKVKKTSGMHSYIAMSTAGLEYTNNGDTARCHTCELEVSGWTSDMIPFATHKQRSPTCPFVLSMLPSQKTITPTTSKLSPILSPSTDEKKLLKMLKTEADTSNPLSNVLVEVDILKQTRKRTFSHWPHRSSPFSSQVTEAGFFGCNVRDRVICIYCNIICQQWTPDSDDPCDVHKILSPKCSYVIAMLTRLQISSTLHVQKSSSNSDSRQMTLDLNNKALNTNYVETAKRHASFATWPNENLPSVDDLVRAGFFYTGTKTIVACFHCNGSLQNWGSNDNPMTEHTRWFPHCVYAKQLLGTELHRKMQESKKSRQDMVNANNLKNASETSSKKSTSERLLIPDEDTLSCLVTARLGLPVSQSLLDHNFKLSIIKRCWADQLRLKGDDFVSDCDLLMACTILQKQIEHIGGKKENIIVPSIAMKKIRDQERTENVLPKSEAPNMQPTDSCVLCLTEEKCLVYIPCGHLATCVSCGHALRSCPICRREIQAFVRIYS